MPSSRPQAAPLAFFLSGAAGLVYELCWIRRASQVFGSTIFVLSTVLAVFFFGLALGSWFFGRMSERTASPLRLYAKLEALIAVLALLSLPAFAFADTLFGAAYRSLSSSPYLLGLARVGLVAIVIVAPSVLMGGTLPLFVRQFVRERARLGRSVAFLYGLNTFGAAVGVFVAGTLLIPAIGLTGAIFVGAGMSLAAAGLAMSIAPPIAPPESVPSAPAERKRAPKAREIAPAAAPAAPTIRPPLRVLLPALFFLSGFTALGYEIVWTRFLSLVVRNTVYTYTLTLAVVLIGIVIGSWLASFLVDRVRATAPLFASLQIMAGISVLVTVLMPPTAWIRVASELQACAALMLPAAVLMGASFPVAVRLAVRDPAHVGSGVGRVAAINTLGGIVGSLLFGFFVLPSLGLHKGVLLCTGLSVATGLLAFWMSPGNLIGRAVATVAAVAVWLLVPRALPTKLPHDFLTRTGTLVEVREGLLSNLAVIDEVDDRILEIDRWWQGQRRPTQQIMAGHVPMLLHPNPKSVLVLGAGAGQTPSRVPLYAIERLDCVDIEPAVFGLIAKHFESEWLQDPRVRLGADDGRNVVAHTKDRYDVISMEIGQLYRPGVPTFYASDFYRQVRARLNPGGVASQLLKLSLPPDVVRGLVRSFIDVFPQSILWYNTNEFLLLGVNADRIVFDRSRLAVVRGHRAINADFGQRYFGDVSYALRNPSVFLGGIVCGPEGLVKLAGDARPYRDDPPTLDYRASRIDPSQQSVLENVAALRALPSPIAVIVTPPLSPDTLAMAERVRELDLGQAEAEALLNLALEGRAAGNRQDLVTRALRANPENVKANRMMAEWLINNGQFEESLTYLEKATAIQPGDSRVRRALGAVLLELGRVEEAIPHLQAALYLDPEDKAASGLLGRATSLPVGTRPPPRPRR